MTRCLIVRLGALGDIVHAIPVAAALRRHFAGVRIDWLVSAKHRDILDLVPVVDRRVIINDRAGASGGASLLASVRELRRERYDAAIDLQGLIKSALLARASGAKRVIGFASTFARERFAHVFYTDTVDPAAALQGRTPHVVESNLALLRAVGITAERPEYPIDAIESAVARQMRDITGGRYLLINPGAAWPNKRWPPDRLGAVAAALHHEHSLRSVVLWGPGEDGLAAMTVAAAGGAAVLCPPTTIRDIVALARGAALMIAGDTGPMHLASAVGAPVVGIYGPTRPSRNGPLSPLDVAVSRDDVCRCPLLRRCTAKEWCLLDIGIEDVVAAARRRLTAEPARV